MYHGEKFNTITHLLGFIFALVASTVLITVAAVKGDGWRIFSFSVYGIMMVLLYGSSTIYHWVKGPWKAFFQRLDYLSIYLMIAGSYTPFALVTLTGLWKWTIFGVIWGLAFLGIAQEIMIGKKTRRFSLIIYVLMGWLIIVATKPMLESLPMGGVYWLMAGGFFYTSGVGVFIYDEQIKHGHGIWHLFVLAGTACHFASLVGYVM